MSLSHLGEREAASVVEQSAAAVLPTMKTMGGPDMGATTDELGDRIAGLIAEQ